MQSFQKSYDKFKKSTTKDEQMKSLKVFKSDINKHIVDVKTKYLIPGETSEIALIFIPSEQVYLNF